MSPSSTPLPGPLLVTKKVVLGAWGGCCCACAIPPRATSASEASMGKRTDLCIVVLPVVDFDLSGESQKASLARRRSCWRERRRGPGSVTMLHAAGACHRGDSCACFTSVRDQSAPQISGGLDRARPQRQRELAGGPAAAGRLAQAAFPAGR